MCGMRASHCGPLPADGVGPGVARTLCPVCRLSGSPHRQVLLQRRAALLQARLLQVRNMHGWSPILSVRQCPGVVHGVQHTHTHTHTHTLYRHGCVMDKYKRWWYIHRYMRNLHYTHAPLNKRYSRTHSLSPIPTLTRLAISRLKSVHLVFKIIKLEVRAVCLYKHAACETLLMVGEFGGVYGVAGHGASGEGDTTGTGGA